MRSADLFDLAERVRSKEADFTMDLSGSDLGWYEYGQEHVAVWLEKLAEGECP